MNALDQYAHFLDLRTRAIECATSALCATPDDVPEPEKIIAFADRLFQWILVSLPLISNADIDRIVNDSLSRARRGTGEPGNNF